MAKYIDKDALVAEIEKYISNYKGILNKVDKSSDDWVDSTLMLDCKIDVLQHLLSFLDTLEVKEEPISNDLEEAAKKIGQKYFPNENNIWARPNYEAVAAENAFKEGAQWQKEQIMKDAIERDVKEDAGGYPYIDATELYDYDNDKPLAKVEDKVKVLIVKDK